MAGAEHERGFELFVTVEHPGYAGKRKDDQIALWNQEYGEGNWRLVWELADGEVLDYEGVFWKVYVPGYVRYFLDHPDEALFLTANFSYAYDKEQIDRDAAFDPYALYDKPGHPNQFHNVALNIALEYFLGLPFKGTRPIQVREGKPGTPNHLQPEGYLWSPGRIATVRPELIPEGIEGWWNKGTIEDLYQSAKVLQVRAKFRPIPPLSMIR